MAVRVSSYPLQPCPACGRVFDRRPEAPHAVFCGQCCVFCGKVDRNYNGQLCATCFESVFLRHRQEGAEVASRAWPVPKRYRDATLSHLPDKQYRVPYGILDRYARAVDQRDKRTGLCLYITGVYGSGKTHAAAAVLNSAQHSGLSTAFCPVVLMIETIRAGLRYDAEDPASEILTQLGAVDLLALDDIGSQAKNDLAAEWLFRIVDERYANKLPTVLTSNLPISELGQDPRFTAIAHRILEDNQVCRFPMVNLREGGRKVGETPEIQFGGDR